MTGQRTDDGDVVDVRGAQVSLGATRVLEDVDLAVRRGELVALLGANGSGKSTLLRTIVGIVPLEAGSARIFGRPVHERSAHRRLGYVPQHADVSGSIQATARETVSGGLIAPGSLFPKRRDPRVDTLLADVGLAELADRPVTAMSGGQRQRVMIARALVRSPSFLVLDEPFAGVDLPTQRSIATIFRRLHERGTTVLVVLHELGPLEGAITRSVVLDHGRVIHDGPPGEGPLHDAGHEHELPVHSHPEQCLGQEIQP